MEELRRVVRTYPLIDNHAHNFLKPTELETYDFLTITTEAHGTALEDTRTSLSHIRAAKQLKELYGCAGDSWDEVTAARKQWLGDKSHDLIAKCLEGTHTILMDDGLDRDTVHPFAWHKQFVSGTVKRIARIEEIASDIMRSQIVPQFQQSREDITDSACDESLKSFKRAFQKEIQDCVEDPEVAGFKSVICYRTGLSVAHTSNQIGDAQEVNGAYREFLRGALDKHVYRLEAKPLNDLFLRLALDTITSGSSGRAIKPIQFHTGLGDNDINLLLSDPAHLQPLIEEYPEVPFIILHSSYPFTRNAGYLATVYSNAYLDLGEVFPMLSRHGEEIVIRQALELAPWSKLLWSTDGHWFPETYWLANVQFRLSLEKILVEFVEEGDLTERQAVQLVQDILFHNSNRVYNLNLKPPNPTGSTSISSPPDMQNLTPASPHSNPRTYDLSLWTAFESQHEPLSYIYVQWLDYMATTRTRVLPAKEFNRLLSNNGQLGISRGNTGTLQNDGWTPAVNPVGQIYVRPDLQSLRLTHPADTMRIQSRNTATVMASFCDADARPLPACPRSRLAQIVTDAKQDHGIEFLVGFEIEVVYLQRGADGKPGEPYTSNHAWSTCSPEQWEKLNLLRDTADSLAAVGIEMQQFHAESAPGQFELVLPPLPPLAAIDTLINARAIVAQLAHARGLRATLHPSPARDGAIGTASHAHISLTPASLDLAFFTGGVLAHLRGICAFTMPEAPSYKRVVDSSWTSGSWVCWGTQNREVPLRRVVPGRWEVRCFDGCANPYLAVAAVLGAGLLGLEKGEAGKASDCRVDPSRLSDAERKEVGIVERLPRSLEEALGALEEDKEMADVLGEVLVGDFVAMKREEQKMLEAMPEDERRIWLIERY